MIISAHQPAYMPWLGYLDRIRRSDVFVFLDTVQFEKNSFINRNKIKMQAGTHWLTMPVRLRGHMSSNVAETPIDNDQPWRRKHLGAIEAAYGRARFFRDLRPKLETIMSGREDLVAELCWLQLQFWLAEFKIDTKVVRASELGLTSRKSDLVLEICQTLSATRYISGPFGKDYLNENAFVASGVEIEYDHYEHPVYPQLWGNFIQGLSCLDLWMNVGPGQLPLTGC